MKKMFAALAAALCLVSGAWASGVWNLGNVTYNLQHLGADEGGDVLTGTLNSAQKLSINDGGTITLRNATIDLSSNSPQCAGLTCEGSATIILEGENTINGISSGKPGIYVPSGSTLTIKGTGTLNASGNGSGSGIGGGLSLSCGNIVIEGSPTINATGGQYCAAIGGGGNSGTSCGTITIKGGTINATGGYWASAIGSGYYASCGNISITGGTVTATGGADAAAIGGGYHNESCGSISIGGGITQVVATRTRQNDTDSGYAIGRGYNGVNISTTYDGTLRNSYNSGTLTRTLVPWDGNLANLSQTSVKAANGTTITGRLSYKCKIIIASGASVTLSNATINGASINSSDNDSYKFAGITCEGWANINLVGDNTVSSYHSDYPGIYVPTGDTLYLRGSGTLTATGRDRAAGIGAGYNLDCGNISIGDHTGAPTINATGGTNGAGIGGAYSGSCGNITINAGTITATGGAYAAGIGGGYWGSSCGTISITGGTVTATGGNNCAGIGSGYGNGGTCGNITIGTRITRVVATCGSDCTNTIGAAKSGAYVPVGIANGLAYRYSNNYNTRTIEPWDGNLSTLGSDVVVTKTTTITGTLSSAHKISIASGASVTLENAKINSNGTESGSESTQWAGLTCEGSATITLSGENTVRGFFSRFPAIHVPSGSTLTIKGTGSLNALHTTFAAGIGGGYDLDCGNIVIQGNPTINAKGGNASAGIGGGPRAACGNITIGGGTITAYNVTGGAAIGSGVTYGTADEEQASCGNIYIGGGNITATAATSPGTSAGGAGIGSGEGASCENITIQGGTVTATGGGNAAGIGSGCSRNDTTASCGTITINRGIYTVTATCGSATDNSTVEPIGKGDMSTCGTVTVDPYLADGTSGNTRIVATWDNNLANLTGSIKLTDGTTITGTLPAGSNHKITITDGASITLNNATIATGVNNSSYAWAGLTCEGNATITLVGENTVKGFYEDYPGIYVPPGKTLTIQGSGSLTASSNGWGAGIGAGYNYSSGDHPVLNCGNIVINGGAITATGGRYAAGIGGGHSSSCGNITINYNPSVLYVKAICDSDATPIGAGSSGSSAGNVSVNSGLFDLTRGNTREITKIRSAFVSGTQWDYCLLSDGAFICSRGGGEPQCAVSPKPEGRLAIPATLGGETVVGLGDSAFYYCNSVTGVEIPSTVTFIGDRAFAMCFALEDVVIPSGVTSIGRGAFAGTDLSSVELPSGLKNIAPETFNNCDYLVDVSIPGSVTNIGDNAFANCDRLERVVIPDGVARIGEFAFADSSIAEVVIPPSVVTVERQAFVRTFLTDVYVSSSSEATRVRGLLEEGYSEPEQGRVPDKDNINYIVGGFEVIDGVTWYYLINETNGLYNGPATATIARKDAQGNYIPAVSPSLTGEVTIPATLGGYPVVRIGEKALNGLADITSVTIPADVTSIDFAAFAWCAGLESVTFEGEVLDHIGMAAFEGCSSLASVDIPDSTCAILERAFGSCTGLQEIKLPYGNEGLAEIGQNAFQSCAPTKIYLPYSDNRSIYQGRLVNPGAMNLANATIVVTGCTYDWGGYTWTYSVEDGKIELYNKGDVVVSPSPTGVLEFPNTSNSYIGYPIVSIGENAFNGCSGLTGVVIPSTVTNISSGAFKNCEDLGVLYVSIGDTARVRALLNSDNIDNTGILIVEQGVGSTSDGSYALYFRTSDGATASIYGFAGQGASLTIPDTIGGFTVTGISAGAFADGAFTSVTLPAGIFSVGWQAFNNTLKNVYVPDGVSVSDAIYWFESAASASGKTFYGSETDGYGVTWYFRVPPAIGDSRVAEVYKGEDTPAFSAPDGTTELTVPTTLAGYGVAKIGEFAFYRSTNLTTVDIPASVTSIGNYAFSYCSSLESIELPQGLTEISECMFAGCSKLTEIAISAGVTKIGFSAFRSCRGLKTLVIPQNIASIGSQAFFDCTALTAIMVPANFGNIVSDANKDMFQECSALQTIYVPYGCEDDVWSSLYSSGINTFAVRDGGFEKVGDYTWYYAFNDGGQTVRIERKDKLHNLISAVSPAPVGAVQIPYTLGGYAVTGIGEKAFWNCSYLDGVVLTDYITSIGAGAFFGCADPLLIQVGMNRKSEVEQLLSQSGHDMTKINVDSGCVVDENGYYWYYNLVSDGNGGWTAEITDLIIGQNECQELVVPETLGGYPVASLANYAFSDRLPSTTTVTFPASVQTIGYGAFIGCDSLTTINVPAGSGAAMTAMLEESGLDMANITVVDPEPAKTVAEVAAELFDDAVINLTGETPSITIKTIPGFTYTVKEGQTLQGMTWKSGEGKVKVGDGNDWSPTLQKYSGSGFYTIGVRVTE
ncbi:MAG: leucine-rich repeat protein [Kiritimatiellae bacterium]|nr:leucine-rich repeat protein [Kiritimatiellia bacterium]